VNDNARVWFTDRDLGKQFPRILAEAGLQVERHAELFEPSGSDEQWLEHCGTKRRVAITHNSRIRYVPNELLNPLSQADSSVPRCGIACRPGAPHAALALRSAPWHFWP
jgi:hypothetical protein